MDFSRNKGEMLKLACKSRYKSTKSRVYRAQQIRWQTMECWIYQAPASGMLACLGLCDKARPMQSSIKLSFSHSIPSICAHWNIQTPANRMATNAQHKSIAWTHILSVDTCDKRAGIVWFECRSDEKKIEGMTTTNQWNIISKSYI